MNSQINDTMPRDNDDLDFVELICCYLDDQLEGDGLAAFNDQLRNNAACRQTFVGYCPQGKLLAETLVVGVPSAEDATQTTNPLLSTSPCPPIPSAISTFPSVTLHGEFSYFSFNGLMAYLLATVILAVGLAAMAVIPVSQSTQFVTRVESSKGQQQLVATNERSIGQITGMVDCQWNDQEKTPLLNSSVSLGTKYALASGLMEITYDTGAKVILQGPVKYEVESENGGFMSVGKLTGKVENPKAKGFAVHTPTAVVTDLGTEFGVEVNNRGDTMSHVFRGSIRVQALNDDSKSVAAVKILRENESARVEKGDGSRILILKSAAEQPDYVRSIPRRIGKMFDLADVVAGGNGFSERRNRGIDATTGKTVSSPPHTQILTSDNLYHPVKNSPFIDGVFIPGNSPAVQTDSSGHRFDAFGTVSGQTIHYIWSGGGPLSVDLRGQPLPTVLGGVDYSGTGHSLIHLHANKGITFNLNAIRKANSGYEPTRFTAIVGNAREASFQFCGKEGLMPLFQDDFQAVPAGTLPLPAQDNLNPTASIVGHWSLEETFPETYQVANNADPASSECGNNHYLHVQRPTGDVSMLFAGGWQPGITANQTVQVSASVWVSSENAVATFCGFTDREWNGRSFSVYLDTSGSVRFFDGNVYVTTSLTACPNAWHDVTVTANMAAKTFSIKVDDQPPYAGGRWTSGVNAVEEIYFGANTNGAVCFDNIKVLSSVAQAVAINNKQPPAFSDVWILVDGERRSGRRGFDVADRPFRLVAPLTSQDRFLTIVVTDHVGTGVLGKWLLFGDPRLDLSQTK
jgi:hypothetical protein